MTNAGHANGMQTGQNVQARLHLLPSAVCRQLTATMPGHMRGTARYIQ